MSGQSPAEKRIERSIEGADLRGKPLSQRARQTERSLESYLRGGVMPRFMTRLREIEDRTRETERELAAAHRRLRATAGEAFAEQWRARLARWPFEDLNELIREHNQWYPVERNLPMDPRTRDYVKVCGRSYRREELSAEWALSKFPAG